MTNSLEEFIRLVTDIRHRWTTADNRYFNPWFRGQTNASWGLIPSIYRNQDFKGREQAMRANFKRQGSLLVMEHMPSSDLEWYFLMQHYGAPTRLLDWSDGALIALYFALCPTRAGSSEVSADAAIWVLDPKWLNQQVLGKRAMVTVADEDIIQTYLPSRGEIENEFPIALVPQNIARRLGVQRSRFTIHGYEEDGLRKLGRRNGSRLAKIKIKKSAIDRMRMDLTTCGIWDTTIFPDLEGLSREIIRDHTDNWV